MLYTVALGGVGLKHGAFQETENGIIREDPAEPTLFTYYLTFFTH